MEIKNTEKQLVFSYQTKTNLLNLMEGIGEKPNELMQELQKQGINPTGPQIWSYEGSDGNPETEFTLIITVPVAKKGQDISDMKFNELPAYKYVETTHKGPYAEFGKVYENFMGEIAKANLKPDGSSREVYINCDFVDQNNCVTDIQIGVK
jgi:effector-binding domain-containing protein